MPCIRRASYCSKTRGVFRCCSSFAKLLSASLPHRWFWGCYVQNRYAIAAIEAFDITVLCRNPGCVYNNLISLAARHSWNFFAMYSGPLSHRMLRALPLSHITFSSTLMALWARNDIDTSCATATLSLSSMMLRCFRSLRSTWTPASQWSHSRENMGWDIALY